MTATKLKFNTSVAVIVAINAVLMFFASFLAVGNDGRAGGIYVVWIVGYLWTAALAVAAFRLCALGKNSAGIVVATITLPVGWALSVVAFLSGAAIVNRESPEFKAACENVRLSYVARPSSPVHSIAYDRGEKRPTVDINHIALGSSSSVTSAEYRNFPYPPQIKFTEEKRYMLNKQGKHEYYFRNHASHPMSEEIQEFTADVLVSYRYIGAESELRTATVDQGVVGYEVTVKDRRSDQILASMVYFTHMARNRACGPSPSGVISVREFVLKATGVT